MGCVLAGQWAACCKIKEGNQAVITKSFVSCMCAGQWTGYPKNKERNRSKLRCPAYAGNALWSLCGLDCLFQD